MISRTLSAFAACLVTVSASTGWAGLIAHESFDYSGNTAHGQGAAGDGWGGAWSLTQNGPDNFHALGGASLAYPGGVALTPSGGRVANMSDEILRRPLDVSIPANPATPRELWISMLVRKNDNGSIDFGFERADNTRRLVWGFSADERFRVNVDNENPFYATDAVFPVDTTLLVVVRLSLTNTTDSIALKVFRPGDAIVQPVEMSDFDVFRAGATGIVLDRFFIKGNNQVQEVDEIRIGDTFADVVPIPEPGAMGLMGAAGLLALRRP